MTQHYDFFIRRFIAALHEALPECAMADLYWGYHCFTGALTLSFATTGRIDRLSGGLCKWSDIEQLYGRMVMPFAGGLRMLAAGAEATAGDGWIDEANAPSRMPLVQRPPRLAGGSATLGRPDLGACRIRALCWPEG